MYKVLYVEDDERWSTSGGECANDLSEAQVEPPLTSDQEVPCLPPPAVHPL